ncbi:hypothetical protein HDU76_003842 [Blyttiomyces sp. JEL0837]|nr:hypothetical protein HDU76_003842 [Blyttiomyces sp. JEL0837]
MDTIQRRVKARQSNPTTKEKEPSTSTKPVDSYLITGGSGQLGHQIVRYLLTREYHNKNNPPNHVPARIAVYDMVNIWQDEPRVEFISGSVTDLPKMVEACKGRTKVIHTVSLILMGAYDGPRLFEVNCLATKNVIEAAYMSDTVEALVFTSSATASAGNEYIIGKETPIEKVQHFFPYARSKAVAEQMVLKSNTDVVRCGVLRPCALWSADDKITIPRVFLDPNEPTVLVPGVLQDVVYSKDCARAHVMLVDALTDPAKRDCCAGKAYYYSASWMHLNLGVYHFLTTDMSFDNKDAERDFGYVPEFGLKDFSDDVARLCRVRFGKGKDGQKSVEVKKEE